MAQVALEKQPTSSWEPRALSESNENVAVAALNSLARAAAANGTMKTIALVSGRCSRLTSKV